MQEHSTEAHARHDLFHEEKNGGSEEAFDILTNWLFENT